MAAPSNFTRSLLRWTLAQDDTRDALEALVIAGAGSISTSGKQLTGASANGKSFSYTIPPGMSGMEVLGAMEEALTLFDSFADADAVAAYLAIRPPSRTVSRGVGFVPANYPC
jgi:thiamine biosynthesis lipoprotein ApbE